MCCLAAGPGALAGEEVPPLNGYVLAAVRSMPAGGGYEASQKAVDRLAAAVTYEAGVIRQDPGKAGASFCSGATYLVFLRAIEMLRKNGSVSLPERALVRYADLDVKDGEEVFGRWNANGPGTAKLFAELGCGVNFTDYESARAGDFMKIWWTDEIGGAERGHLVVLLGQTKDSVSFWSSNQPSGYGRKSVAKEKIKRVLFSRLTDHRRLKRASGLGGRNRFLAEMLHKRFRWEDVVRECRVREKP